MKSAGLPGWIQSYLSEEDEDGFVPFNHDRRLGQNQYVSHYVDGRYGGPNLGQNLRWKSDGSSYHSIRIHKDDLVTFHERVESFQEAAREGRSWP